MTRRDRKPVSSFSGPGPGKIRYVKASSRRAQCPARKSQWIAVAVTVIAMLIALIAVWYLLDVFLLAFGGLLLAVLLRSLTEWLSKATGLPRGWSLLGVLVGAGGLCVALGWWLVPHILEQWDELTRQIPQAAKNLTSHLRDYTWGERLYQSVSRRGDEWSKTLNLFRISQNVFMQTAGVVTSFLVLAFVAMYLAYDPDSHRTAVIRLVPPPRRDVATACIGAMIHVLKWWLLGKGLSMLLVGMVTWLGLWLLGVPLAAALALIAFVLAFVPNLGPIVSVIPAVLVASTESLSLAVYVMLLYFAIQAVESYLITPLIQERSVSLPPAMIILGQVVMGVLAGALGVALATPLLAAFNACLQNLYGGHPPENPSEEAS